MSLPSAIEQFIRELRRYYVVMKGSDREVLLGWQENDKARWLEFGGIDKVLKPDDRALIAPYKAAILQELRQCKKVAPEEAVYPLALATLGDGAWFGPPTPDNPLGSLGRCLSIRINGG